MVYRDRIWVLGGWSRDNGNFGDVWYYRDGENWIELKSDVIWTNRHEHSAVVFQDNIWLYGGYADLMVDNTPSRALNSGVWSLEIPGGWFDDD